MNREIRLLRFLLWSQISLAVAGLIVAIVLDKQLSAAAQEFNRQLYEGASDKSNMMRGIPAFVWIAAGIGLLRFQSWAKGLYLASTGAVTLMKFIGLPSFVMPGAATALFELATMAAGATLLLLYGTEFGKSWKTVRA